MYVLRIAAAFFCFLTVTTPVILPQDAPAISSGEITITAKKYAFMPNVIRVKRNVRVKLLITAVDADHGFKLEAFHVEQKLKKGETATIEFTPGEAGTYRFQCSHFCGLGHGKMKGLLIVE